MKIHRSPACEQQISKWLGEPDETMHHRIADFAVIHTDAEVRDELITYFDEDPPDSPPVRAALELWPLLLLNTATADETAVSA